MVATMRYLHSEAAGIREYMRSLGLTAAQCDFEGRFPSIPADAGAISNAPPLPPLPGLPPPDMPPAATPKPPDSVPLLLFALTR
jgi:hypothetical protein